MKKYFPLVLVALVCVSIATSCGSSKKSASSATKDVKTGKAAIVNVDACDVLTSDIAKQILGDTAVKGETSAGNVSNENISVTNCVYTAEIDPNALKFNNTNGVSVLARSAKSDTGATENKANFDSDKLPAGTQNVSGVGDKAFFNPKFGQLNVLKGGNYYIVTNYKGKILDATLEDDKALAELLTFK